MVKDDSRRHSRASRDSGVSTSWQSAESQEIPRSRNARLELSRIRLSLDRLSRNLESQQLNVVREFEDRVRQVYDAVVNDLNEVRNNVNSIGDLVAGDCKFKTWSPTIPFRKGILESIHEVREPVKAVRSQSLMSLGTYNHVTMTSCPSRSRAFGHSSSMRKSDSSLARKSVRRVEGYGCCFGGSSASIPRQCRKAGKHSDSSPRHSWGPSRSGSRSTLDDFDETEEELDDEGETDDVKEEQTPDWRLKVTSFMWEGWAVWRPMAENAAAFQLRLEQFRDFRDQLLRVHNYYRGHHGCPELTVSDELTRDAQQWADVIAEKGYAQYSELSSRGENVLLLEVGGVTDLTGELVGDTWYRESKLYDFTNPRWQRGTTNFTQMVWRATSEMGVGVAKWDGPGRYVVVAQYRPQGNGNQPGQFLTNVPPLQSRHTQQ